MSFPMLSSVLFLGLFSASVALSQSTGSSPSSQPPVYTLHANKRVVLTDVTVTDRKGNPIRGLNASAFEILDNEKPQDLASFEEHSGPPTEASPSQVAKPGTYSNDFLQHPPPVFNVLLIDVVSIDTLPRQMSLHYELTEFVKHLQAGEPVAIYMRWGPYLMVLQNFTSDRTLLLAAVSRALPRFQSHEGRVLSEMGLTHEIALNLSKFPGRKNVFWFCGNIGGDPMRADPTTLSGYSDLRPNYDELEAARIAIYPIDARGLFDPGLRGADALWFQHLTMTNVAEATGGRAVYNRNFVAETTSHLIEVSNDFYTLSYSPHDFLYDNSWHKVKVTLKDKSYLLSYRHGYFADGNDPRNKADANDPRIAESLRSDESRTKLLPDGSSVEVKEVKGPSIIFQASVLPADPSQSAAKKGTIPYTIHYSLPLNKLVMQSVDGERQATMGIASLAFDGNGRSTANLTQQVTANFTEEALRVSGEPVFTFDQQIDLKDGENYLYLGVWDVNTGQFGTIQLSMDVTRPKAGHQDANHVRTSETFQH
jgi:VWFA-related protein